MSFIDVFFTTSSKNDRTRKAFFPGIFFMIFAFFAHLWWIGGLGLASYIGFLGLRFSVDGVSGLWCGAFWVYLG